MFNTLHAFPCGLCMYVHVCTCNALDRGITSRSFVNSPNQALRGRNVLMSETSCVPIRDETRCPMYS